MRFEPADRSDRLNFVAHTHKMRSQTIKVRKLIILDYNRKFKVMNNNAAQSGF